MNASRLFDQIVDLTSIRDIELLEFSLLRTIHQYLKPIDARIFKTNSRDKLISEIVFSSDNCHVFYDEKELSGDVKFIIDHITKTEAVEFSKKIDKGYLTIYRIHKTHATSLYIQIHSHDRISRENKRLLNGLLEIFRNYICLIADNITDSLTGLLNRKSFDSTIDKIYKYIPEEVDIDINNRRNSINDKYWLVMLDVDHFKSVNDKYGHLYGDDVLILLAQLIKASFRDDDLSFRFGGEEFVLIIRCENSDGAKFALQRLLEKVSNYIFPQVGTVTISAGAVRIDPKIFSGTLLEYADQALYHSKNNGRNQVTFFDDLVNQGITKEQEIEFGEIALF